MSPYDTRFGYCKCGCGQKTNIAQRNDANRDWVRGQPISYIRGHGARSKLSDEDRFYSYIDCSGGPDACWPWIGCCFPNGYGQIKFAGKTRSAHVVAWYLTFGKWPTLQILHRCDSPA